MINARRTTRQDSKKNCLAICHLNDPMAFRMPTSLALFSLLAVLRFIKLMHASINTKMPMAANSQTQRILPPVFMPFLNSLNRFHLLMGCRKTCHLYLFSSGLTLSSFRFLIFAEAVSIVALSASCTNVCEKLLLQGACICFTHGFSISHNSHGMIAFISRKLVLSGKSSYTPVTLTRSVRLNLSVLLIGFSAPKIACAVDDDNRIE